MLKKDADVSFYGVAIAFIILGTIIFAFGLVAWYIGAVSGVWIMNLPFFKVIGGLIVMALGYIVLQMEMLRKK